MELWFTGRKGRCKKIEVALPALVKREKIRAMKHGKMNVYGTTDRFTSKNIAVNLYHGLQCTEILVRVALANPGITVIGERTCQGFKWGRVPEWAIELPNGQFILLEFCTADNVWRGMVASKVNKYREILPLIEATLNGEVFILFVLDVKPAEAKEVVSKFQDESFMFTDYDTFIAQHPLKKHDQLAAD